MPSNSARDWEVVIPIVEKEKFFVFPHRHSKKVPLHSHAFLELSYILRGQVEHRLDGETSSLHPGDYLLVDYGSCHSYSATETDFDNVDCLFLPELLDPVLRGSRRLSDVLGHYLLHFNTRLLMQNPAKTVFHDDDGRIRQLIERMEEESAARRAGYAEMIRCYLIEILLITMRKLDDASAAATGDDISAFLTAYVVEHYMEPLTLRELSAKLNYSIPYISKRFKEETGETFVHFLRQYRVSQARRLLLSTRYSFSEITELVGYHDVKFFSALFRELTGMTPAEIRKQR